MFTIVRNMRMLHQEVVLLQHNFSIHGNKQTSVQLNLAIVPATWGRLHLHEPFYTIQYGQIQGHHIGHIPSYLSVLWIRKRKLSFLCKNSSHAPASEHFPSWTCDSIACKFGNNERATNFTITYTTC